MSFSVFSRRPLVVVRLNWQRLASIDASEFACSIGRVARHVAKTFGFLS